MSTESRSSDHWEQWVGEHFRTPVLDCGPNPASYVFARFEPTRSINWAAADLWFGSPEPKAMAAMLRYHIIDCLWYGAGEARLGALYSRLDALLDGPDEGAMEELRGIASEINAMTATLGLVGTFILYDSALAVGEEVYEYYLQNMCYDPRPCSRKRYLAIWQRAAHDRRALRLVLRRLAEMNE